VTPLDSQIFLTLFPEFQKVQKATLDAYINIAIGRVPAPVWGTNAQYATALLTAHMLTAQGRGGQGSGGGAITQEQVGDLSRTFATVGEPGSGDQNMLTTRYGSEFVGLRKETIVTIQALGGRRPPYFPGRY
jgi:hypothetical protein